LSRRLHAECKLVAAIAWLVHVTRRTVYNALRLEAAG
jgi:hypothetical protein